MPKPLVLPPDHRVVITVDADKTRMAVTIVAYRRGEWLGEVTVNALPADDQLQDVVDMLTHRGPRPT